MNDKMKLVIQHGLSRKSFIIWFLMVNILFSLISYAIVISQISSKFWEIELGLRIVVSLILCILFYYRLKNVSYPAWIAIVPIIIAINSVQVVKMFGVSNIADFTVLDLLEIAYYAIAIFLMIKKTRINKTKEYRIEGT